MFLFFVCPPNEIKHSSVAFFMSEADFPYTIFVYSLTVQYCTVQDLLFVIKKRKNQKRNTNAGGAPIRGGFARPPRSCYVFDLFSHLGSCFGMNADVILRPS